MSRLVNCTLITVLLTASAFEANGAGGSRVAPAGDPPQACQTAVLHNGFTLRFVRREAVGEITRLWVCGDANAGYVEFPTEQIERFEQSEGTFPQASGSDRETIAGVVPLAAGSFDKLITWAASQQGIDPDFVTSVVKAESGFNPKAISSKGARGLMQLMPQTAASLGVENVFDPASNIEGGTRYLRQLLDQYHGDAVNALAAYNAGPQQVELYGGIPPFRETRTFVTRVIDDFNRRKADSRAANQ